MKLSAIPGVMSGAKSIDPVQTSGYQANIPEVEIVGKVAPATNVDGSNIDQQRNPQHTKEEVSEAEADRRMKSVIDQANSKVKHSGTRQLAFSYNENTKRISIKVYDALTKEIIREIPPEKTLEMLERVYDIAGIMVDEKR